MWKSESANIQIKSVNLKIYIYNFVCITHLVRQFGALRHASFRDQVALQ